MKILNEYDYTENIIKNGFTKNKYVAELRILAKYYFQQGIKGEDLKDIISKFCSKNIKDFNMVTWAKTINYICKYGETNSLFNISPIRVTDKEMDKIQSLKNLKFEKVAFVILILAKINKQSYMLFLKDKIKNSKNKTNHKFRGYVITESINEIFQLAKVHVSKDKRFEIIRHLVDLGFIDVTKNGKIRVDFVNNHSTENTLVVSKFNNFVLDYMKYIGDNIGDCEVCGDLIEIKGKNHKYCISCWNNINKQQIKKRVQKHRNKDKCNGF